jgi:phosphoribosylformimino-5-aminoimidazole carboxamide ribotide isomerase/phosphoribosyl-ATP pyrophosphohydrolase/phosphoribosyl-AMP cyclohydrolase
VKEKNENKQEKTGKQEAAALSELPAETAGEAVEEDLQPLDEVEELQDSDIAQESSSVPDEPPADTSGSWPLVVCDESGGFLFLASTNRKGYTKSLEQKALWVNHPETDRILPSGKEAQLKRIQERDGYYYAEVVIADGMDKSSPGADKPATRRDDLPPLEILAELETLIAQRKQDNPEGSYTAYLFQSGPDKIRKKTGEEAIELVLAHEKNDIVYETADLIYHILVLLAAEEIPLSAVMTELETRR